MNNIESEKYIKFMDSILESIKSDKKKAILILKDEEWDCELLGAVGVDLSDIIYMLMSVLKIKMSILESHLPEEKIKEFHYYIKNRLFNSECSFEIKNLSHYEKSSKDNNYEAAKNN